VKSKNLIEGIIVPIISPIDEQEELDEDGFRSLLQYSIKKGIHGFFVAGTNGETMALTQEQRNRIIKIAIEETRGVVPVLCGVMDTSTKRVLKNIQWVEENGGKYIVITPVFYARHACPEEQVRHFGMIAKSTSLQIFIYNIPQFTGVNISPDIFEQLKEYPNIIGIKESSANFTQFLQYLYRNKNSSYSIFQGITELAGPSILLGANGCNPVLAPLFPELYLELYKEAKARNVERTYHLTNLVLKSGMILKMTANATAAAKYALSTLGFTKKHCLRPTEPIKAEEEQKISEWIERLHQEFIEYGIPSS